MLVWDNQQETSWFVGILEAEGNASKSKCSVSVSNKDKSIIDACMTFLVRKAITYGLWERDDGLWTVTMCGWNNVNSLLLHLGNSFQCRHQEFLNNLKIGSSTTTRDASLTADLHWLVGIFEGEGCLGLREDKNCLTPDIRCVNTNERILEKIAKTLHSLDLPWYVNGCQIRIGGLLRCQRFLQVLSGLWRSKVYNRRAKWLLEFISSRLLVPKGSSYTKEQLQIYSQLKMMI